LSRAETRAYIEHRLGVAGANGRPTFSRGALLLIHHSSGGVPRLINAICDTTLLAGYVDGADRLTFRHVRRAVHQLDGDGA
jgi:type II secretory pathway predicted ATPase ExeA